MGTTADDRGRSASSPREVPARGWKDVALRVKDEVKTDQVPLLAAGVAFYAMLALFPALIAVVSVYGLVADPADVQRQITSLTSALPESAASLIGDQLSSIVNSQSSSLSWGLALSLGGVLWSVSSGVQGLIKGLNVAYDEDESRGFVKLRGLALLLTLGAIVGAIAALGLIVVVPIVLRAVGLGAVGEWAVRIGRWPLLALLVAVGLAVVYRYGPDRHSPRWRWVGPGAAIATVLWILGSIGFSVYVNNFGSYNQTYGSLGAVIVLLLWLFLTSFVVLLGAEIDAELEHQTARDTTVGSERPLGRRDAYVADHVGEPAGGPG